MGAEKNLFFGNDPNSMDQSWNIAEKSEQNVEPEMFP